MGCKMATTNGIGQTLSAGGLDPKRARINGARKPVSTSPTSLGLVLPSYCSSSPPFTVQFSRFCMVYFVFIPTMSRSDYSVPVLRLVVVRIDRHVERLPSGRSATPTQQGMLSAVSLFGGVQNKLSPLRRGGIRGSPDRRWMGMVGRILCDRN
ncbi:hypothetical protein BO94DRAFT_30721 [Aspergillus sclerotioniger CBS 115572]|uniref:Uncharacterized protein n=1 Tax=Aspergillus sclerotioniger CBS 115572 TaxID=1450535 RepID=A0A317X1Z9_9EURO|nr:hypothetical protein BO94DRAFT_30721 [Aspergillus sclerotioniger CBS 115572]PWY90570.1 hypothetical protein BO94DRAFT_30721 [Aspergillus sclerotioniger CBS 115572]